MFALKFNNNNNEDLYSAYSIKALSAFYDMFYSRSGVASASWQPRKCAGALGLRAHKKKTEHF